MFARVRLVGCLALLALVGCGGKTDIPMSVDGQGADGATTQQHVLVGEWHGPLELNEARAQEMLEPEMIEEARSMTMTIEFDAGGEMAMLAVTQTPEGPQEIPSISKWEIVGEQGSHYTVKSTEGDAEPEEIQVELVDANTILVAAPDDLGMFRLARRTE